MIRLSICIATYSRAAFIGATLESIVPQLRDDVELLILDGASPDDTAAVVAPFLGRHPNIVYHREETNSGVDADYDKAVGRARGEYCWLMPDDDLLAPQAVAGVLGFIEENPDLIIVDAEVRDLTMTETILPRRLSFSGVRRYGAGDQERLMKDIGDAISFIGAVIIRRDVWLARDRQSYYGSLFIHAGVIFQQPPLRSAIVVGEPYMLIRYGNSMWTSRSFEVWAVKWPTLIWSFDHYSEEVRSGVAAKEEWARLSFAFSSRAKGSFGWKEYRQFFGERRLGWRRPVLALLSLVPGRLAHVAGTAYLGLKGEIQGMGAYDLLHRSRFSNALSRRLAKGFAARAGRPKRDPTGPSPPA